ANTASNTATTTLQVASAPPPTSTLTYTATYFVATDGYDSNPGTQSRPFRTINKGVSMLTPGAIVYIRGGTYAESLFNVIPSGNSWDLPVTIAAYPGETVIMQPPPGSFRVINIQGSEHHHIIIDGLVLDSVNAQYDAVKIDVLTSDQTTAAHHIRIMNSEIRNAQNNGLLVIGDNNELINLHVHHNALA